jgi:chemotaxis protein histidine kinase CheA/CheY-like chemotaxis protein
MSTIDNHHNTSDESKNLLIKISVIAEELSSYLSSHKRKHKGLIKSCLEYVARIAEAAIESDFLGLYEFCALYQERLLAIDKSEAKISQDVREALEAWPNIITDLSSTKNPEDRLAEHLNLPCWGLTLSADDIELLKSMFELPTGDNPEFSTVEIVDTSTSAEIETDSSDEELSEAVLELIAILYEEFEELQSQLENVIKSSIEPDAEIEAHSAELNNYADMLKDYLDASESIGFKALAQICAHIETNIVVISNAKRLLTGEESALLQEWSTCVFYYLKSVTDEDGAASLAVSLIDEDWPQPLSEDEAAALSLDLVKPDLPEFEDEAGGTALQVQPEDVSIKLPEDVDQELLDALLQEFPDQTEELSAAVQSLIESGNQEDIKVAQRIAHTVKGAGNTVGIPGVANIAHRLEDIFLALTKHNTIPPASLAETMVNATDCLEAMSETLTGTGEAPDNALEILQSILDWIAQIEREGIVDNVQPSAGQPYADEDEETKLNNDQQAQATSGISSEAKGQQDEEKAPESMLRIPASLIEELIRIEGEEVILTSHIHEQVNSIKLESQAMQDKYILLQQLGGKLEELINVKDMSTPLEQQQVADDFDSMEMDQYSELHTNTHLLIEAAADIYEMGKAVSDQLMRLEEIVVDQKRLNNSSQEVALQTRMLPAKTIFSRLKRAVRQVSYSTGKKITLHLNGEETLMAGDTLSDLVEPLMHIVRNAIDHGIEDAEVRTKAGKSVEGNIKVEFLRQGTDIIVRVEDDGAGLDLEGIRSKAEEQEILTPEEEVTEKTLVSMIFRPNFSTRSETTQVSGRGIGMDAVNFSVNKLGGELNLDSQSGKGCVMEIKIPVSLISTHILLLRCGVQSIAVTIHGIEQILSPEDGELIETDNGLMLQLGDESYPVKSLASLLKIPDRRSSHRAAYPIILLRNQEGIDAILVESVMDSREQVVKSMGEYVPKLHGILGVTIMGDGSLIPVLDLPELLRDPGKLAESDYADNVQNGFQLPTAMVVDDSLSVRRSLTQFMEDSGYKVRAARDGIEAIEILKGFKPDILLVDMEMPRMNGIELSAYVRSQDSIAELPIIMITSRSSAKHREQAERAGINSHVTKPFSEEALLEEIERLRTTN